MTEERKTVTADEAASMLGVSLMTISRLVRRGELSGYRLTTAKRSPYRIYVDSIRRFQERRKTR